MADDRWWRGFDDMILDAVPAGSRVLDVGCGDGGLVERLAARGLDSVGVDPRAPAHPLLLQQAVEDLEAIGQFDAVCAVMSLHHADLEPALAAVRRVLRPGGRMFVHELAWEAYDERAATWLAGRDPSGRDNSVAAWNAEHDDLHTGDTVRRALAAVFDVRREVPRPYLARMLGMHPLEHQEQAMIDGGALPPLGRWYFAGARETKEA